MMILAAGLRAWALASLLLNLGFLAEEPRYHLFGNVVAYETRLASDDVASVRATADLARSDYHKLLDALAVPK